MQHESSTLVGSQAGTPSEFGAASAECEKCHGSGHIEGLYSVWGGDPDCQHNWIQIDVARTKPVQPSDKGSKQATNAGSRFAGSTCSTCSAWYGSLGNEPTPELFIEHLVMIFREVRRVLRKDGTLWVNIGDSYAANRSYQVGGTINGPKHSNAHYGQSSNKVPAGLKQKDLVGVPWMLAFALRTDGWYLRQDIIWCLSGGVHLYARTQKGDAPSMLRDLTRLKPETVELWNGSKWTQVTGWRRSAARRKIELVLRSGERIGCTDVHVWPTQRGDIPAAELRAGDVLQHCNLPEPESVSRPPYMTDDLLWFLGLYLAEGSHAGDTVQLSLHVDETKWLDRIRNAAYSVGASMTHSIDGNKLAVRLYGKVLNAVISEYIGGRVARNKHLTNAVWRMPNTAIRYIADGYLAGDSHSDISNKRFRLGFCRNYWLERDLRVLAARLGATLTLKPSVATYQGGTKPAFRGEWRWEASEHGNVKDRGEIIEIRKSRAREFWDVSVADEPHLFALSSGIMTHNSKQNPMPESVTDRCTKSHEYVFLLSKSKEYYFDSEAIKEDTANSNAQRTTKKYRTDNRYGAGNGGNTGLDVLAERMRSGEHTKRNKRSVWHMSLAPFRGAHFATFPEHLVEIPIRAGTPEYGCCSLCCTPFERIIEREPGYSKACPKTESAHMMRGGTAPTTPSGTVGKSGGSRVDGSTATVGWEPQCMCCAGVRGCTVLDPFSGAATTGKVALSLGREYIGIETNPEYQVLAEKRLLDAGLDVIVL